jgi:two-component system response regulator FlrC
VLARGEVLETPDFFLHLEIDGRVDRAATAVAVPAPPPAERTVAAMEQQLILRTVREARANRTEAARRLGISVRTLRNKLNEYRAMGVAVDTLLENAAGE